MAVASGHVYGQKHHGFVELHEIKCAADKTRPNQKIVCQAGNYLNTHKITPLGAAGEGHAAVRRVVPHQARPGHVPRVPPFRGKDPARLAVELVALHN